MTQSPAPALPPTLITPRFTAALEYARAHHAGDLRKGTSIPFLAHLLAVSSIVLEHGGDESQAIAGLLHDVVEDGGGEAAVVEIRERFGADVASIVVGCSDTTAAVKEGWELRKERYLAHLEDAPPEVLLVSAADKLHNTRSILDDLRVHGEALWARFNRGGQAQLWYYGALRDVFLRRMPGPLTDDLDRTVREINLQVGWEDRVAWLGVPFTLWSSWDDRVGAIVDWPGCPLILEAVGGEIVVRGHVGSGGDHCPDVDTDLDDLVSVDLGDLHLDYVEPNEQAWLLATDRGHLAATCARVAGLVPELALELQEAVELDPPITDFEALAERGPY